LCISVISNPGIPPLQGIHFLSAKSFINTFFGAGKGGRTLDLLVGNDNSEKKLLQYVTFFS